MNRLPRLVLSRLLAALGMAVVVGGCSQREAAAPPQADLALLDPALARLIRESQQRVEAAADSAEAWGRLGQAFDVVDYHHEAAICYERASALDPSSARWPHLLGILQLQDRPDEAIRNLTKAANLNDGSVDASRLRLSQALIERGRFVEAISQLDRLLERQPDHPAARVEKARAFLALDKLEAAATLLQPSLTNAYTARPATLLLTTIQQRLGRAESAATLASRAASMPRPFDWPDPYRIEVERLRTDRLKLQDQVNELIQRRRFPEANAALDRLLRAYPNDADGLLLLGRLRIQERKCDQAESVLRGHLRAQPQSINGLTQLAIALICQQRWGEAMVPLREAIVLKPDFGQAHYNLGLCLAQQGEPGRAIESFREALRCTPGDVSAHVALGEEYVRLGRTNEARTHLESVLRLSPNDPRVKRLRDQIFPGQ